MLDSKKLVDTYRFLSFKNNDQTKSIRQKRIYEDDDSAGKMQTIKPKGPFVRKEFGENLSPLKRFLRSNIGNRWDDVFSELSRRMDIRGAVSGHIFDHIFHYVDIEAIEGEDGTVYADAASMDKGLSLLFGFYVLSDGILREVKEKNKKRYSDNISNISEKEKIHISDNKWLLKDRNTGIWYLCKFEKTNFSTKKKIQTIIVLDNYGNRTIDKDGLFCKKDVEILEKVRLNYSCSFPKGLCVPYNIDNLSNSEYYMLSCKQASKKDLKKLGLK
jgi:hypothetical protein